MNITAFLLLRLLQIEKKLSFLNDLFCNRDQITICFWWKVLRNQFSKESGEGKILDWKQNAAKSRTSNSIACINFSSLFCWEYRIPKWDTNYAWFLNLAKYNLKTKRDGEERIIQVWIHQKSGKNLFVSFHILFRNDSIVSKESRLILKWNYIRTL